MANEQTIVVYGQPNQPVTIGAFEVDNFLYTFTITFILFNYRLQCDASFEGINCATANVAPKNPAPWEHPNCAKKTLPECYSILFIT